MRVLVTGGAGYIGSHVVYELIRDGYEVVVVDNFCTGNEKNIFPQTTFIHGNIEDDITLEKAFSKKIDAVFHFAAWKAAGESMTNPEKYTINNLNGTLKLVTKLYEVGCKYFIFSSSAAVYGNPQYLPMDENHPTEPINYYGYTKLAIERNLAWYDKLRGLKYACLRYFNAAGYHPEGKITGIERTTANLLPIVMEAAFGLRKEFQIFGEDYETEDGTCIRDYIHVTDLARAHLLSLDYVSSKNESLIVNLGSENGSSVKEITAIAENVAGAIPHSMAERRPGDPPKLLASSAKARELLNWKPVYSDAETIVKTMYNAYAANYKKP